jgi:hypothetical protein
MSPAMGVSEQPGILWTYMDLVGEKYCDETSPKGKVIFDFLRAA